MTFTAELNPPDESARYHFNFDDGGEVGSGTNKVAHRYQEARDYHPTVVATLGKGETVTSEAITLTIRAVAIVPPGPTGPTQGPKRKEKQRPVLPNRPEPPPHPFWRSSSRWLVVLGLAFVAVAGWRLVRRITSPKLRVIPYSVGGVHQIAASKHLQSGPHISLTLRPGMGAGEHRMIFPQGGK